MGRRDGRGFTTLELMVVITIVGLVTAAWCGSGRDLMEQHRVSSAANEIASPIWLYPVQRQRCPESPARISFSLGEGL